MITASKPKLFVCVLLGYLADSVFT